VAEVNDNQRRELIWEAREYLDPRVHEAEPEGAAYIEALACELEVACDELREEREHRKQGEHYVEDLVCLIRNAANTGDLAILHEAANDYWKLKERA
jgi:methionine synthase II (cobalamin-independent)